MRGVDTGRGLRISSRQNDARDLLAVQRTLQGETEAFTELVHRYTPVLYSLAYRLTDGPEEAEDAVQDIFLRLFDSLHKFNIKSRFFTWMYTVGLNQLRSRLRKRRPISIPITDDRSVDRDIADARYDPVKLVEISADAERLQVCIRRLKPSYRIPFVLRYLETLSIAEIAEILDLPIGTVKVRIHRARRTIVDCMDETF